MKNNKKKRQSTHVNLYFIKRGNKEVSGSVCDDYKQCLSEFRDPLLPTLESRVLTGGLFILIYHL